MVLIGNLVVCLAVLGVMSAVLLASNALENYSGRFAASDAHGPTGRSVFPAS